jgi:hypothetical protein
VTDQRVLQSKLFFLQSRQQIFVRVRAVLFIVDLGMKSGMLRCESLHMGFVHRSISFRWLTRDSLVNKSRNEAFVATKQHGSPGHGRALPLTAGGVTVTRASCKANR